MNMNCEPDLSSAELSQRGSPLDGGGAGTPNNNNNGGQGTVSLGATSSGDLHSGNGTGVSQQQHHHGSPGDQQHALVRTTMAAQQPCDYGDPKQHGGMDLHLQSGGISLAALTRGDSGAYALSNEWSYYSAGSPSPGVQGPPSGAYVGGPNPDPEPTRCRRTDGKKWRCGRQVVHEQKYCEKHMHRGRHRSQRLRDQADMGAGHNEHHLNGGNSGGGGDGGGGGGGGNSRPPQHSASTADLISAALGGNSSGTPSLSTISGISIGSLGLQRSHSSVAAAAAVAAAAMAVPLAPIPKASGLHLQLPQHSQGGQGSPLESPRKRPPQSPQGPRPSLSDSGGSRGVKALRYGTHPLLRGGSYDDRLMDLGEQQPQLQRTMSERSFFPSQEAQAAAAAAASDSLLVNQATLQNLGRTDSAALANAWRSLVIKVPQAPMSSYLQMPDYLQGGAQLVMPSSTAHSSAQQQLRALGGQSQGSGYASQVQMQLNQQNYGTSNLQTPAQSTSDRSFSNAVEFLPTNNSSQQLSMGDTGGLSTPDLTASMAAAKVAQARLAGTRSPEDDDLQVDAGLGVGPGDDRGQRQSTMWASPLWELGGGLGNPLMEVLQQSSTLRSNKTHHQSSSGNSNQGWGQGFNLLNDTYEMSAPPQSPSRQEAAVCHNLETSPRGVLHKPTYGSFSDSSSGSGSPRGQATAAVKTEEAPGARDNPTHGLLLESSLV